MRTPTYAPRWSGPEPLLTYQQLAVWLNDSVRHIRRLVLEDRIPYHKVGHFVRFDPAEIAEWLEANRWRAGSPSGRERSGMPEQTRAVTRRDSPASRAPDAPRGSP